MWDGCCLYWWMCASLLVICYKRLRKAHTSQLIWLLYLTSEEESPFYRIFTMGGNGGLSGYNRRARVESAATGFGESVMPRQNGGGYGYGYQPTGVDSTPQKAQREPQGHREEYGQPMGQPSMQPPQPMSAVSAVSDNAESPRQRAK